MTREEYTQEVKACYSSSQHVDVCEEYIKSLEQRIAELEAPKTCEGCKYNRFGCDSTGVAIDCTSRNGNCARQWYKDYYEPKEQK